MWRSLETGLNSVPAGKDMNRVIKRDVENEAFYCSQVDK